MTARIAAGDVAGSITDYSAASAEEYQTSFLIIGTTSVISDINQIGPLTPADIQDDTAQYYFEQIIDGESVTFPVEFTKENGVWKILEF